MEEVHVGETKEHIRKPSLDRLCKWMKNEALKGIRNEALMRVSCRHPFYNMLSL